MEDFNSKYTGQQVEDLLDQVANGEVGGGTTNVQADWNVSDTTSDSYIKNRTHYAKFSQVSIPTTLNTNSWTEVKLSGIAGQTLYVKYSYLPSHIEASTTLSMNDLNVERTFNNGPNFTIYRGVSSIYIKGFYDENHILEVTTVVHKLPEYFIPSNIARTSELSGKQDTLVSGENIKTINGESILGSGDITISGGSGEGASKEVIRIDNGVIEELLPDNIYILESSGSSFEIQSIQEPEAYYAEYHVIICAEAVIGGEDYSPTIILPDYVYWANGQIPDLTQDAIYELSIIWYSGNFMAGYNAVLTPFKPI